MDKQTFNYYGWIIILVIVAAVLVSLSIPFAAAVKNNFIAAVDRFTNEAQNATGIIGSQGDAPETNVGGDNQDGFGSLAYTISAPLSKNSSNPDCTEESNYTVSGSLADVTAIKSLTVNGTIVEPDADGSWSTTIVLEQNAVTPVVIIITGVLDDVISDTRYVTYIKVDDYALILDNSDNLNNARPIVFVKTHLPIVAGGTYNSSAYGELTVTAVYSDFTETSLEAGDAPWYTDYASTITSISFDDSVTPSSIAYWFYGCTSLVSTPIIPNSVTDMRGAFTGCTSLASAPVIPQGVTDISGAFSGCTALTEAPVIPDSVTHISGVFSGCTSLETAPAIPNSVTDASYAFENCSSLKTAPLLPDGVTNIDRAFAGCASLTVVPKLPDTITDMNGTFSGCSNLTAVTALPSGVTNLSNAFYKCSSLISAPMLPNGVKNIYCAFLGCTSLVTAPEIPDSVTNMRYAFYGCTSLTTAPAIPNSVTDISNTFYNCTALTTAPIIPNTITVMSRTFFGCSSLTGSIIVNANPISYYNCFYGTTNPITIVGSCSDTTKLNLSKATNNGNVSY